MREPFQTIVASLYSDEEIRNLQVDREFELDRASETLGRNYNNLLLYGKRGVGKTFLLRMLEHHMADNFPDVFSVYVRTAGLHMYNPTDEVAAFSRVVLLEICVAIWKTLIKKDYLSLRDKSDSSEASVDFSSQEDKTVQRIFSLLMAEQRIATKTLTRSMGVSMGMKGEMQDDLSVQKVTSDILPFEFAEFVDELISGVLSRYNKNRIIVMCDDANNLPIFTQEEILTRYFEIFRAKNVQFVFVAAWQRWEQNIRIPLCFETIMQLSGFKNFDIFSEFMRKAGGGKVTFDEDALRFVHESSKGEPILALHIGYICWRKLENLKTRIVSLALAEESAKIFWARFEEEARQIQDQA